MGSQLSSRGPAEASARGPGGRSLASSSRDREQRGRGARSEVRALDKTKRPQKFIIITGAVLRVRSGFEAAFSGGQEVRGQQPDQHERSPPLG